MLRTLVVLLVLANAAYFAWTQSYLAPLGMAPEDPTEPRRLQEQVNPTLVRLLNAASPPSAPASAPVAPATPSAPPSMPVATTSEPAPLPTACWRASGLTETRARQLSTALGEVADLQGLWKMDELQTGGRWVVYMGKLSSEMMQRKKNELRAMKVDFREVRVPHLSPGLALGTYSSEAAAHQGLQDVMRKGVRTARVAQEREESTSHTLTLPAVTPPQHEQIQALLGDTTLSACE